MKQIFTFLSALFLLVSCASERVVTETRVEYQDKYVVRTDSIVVRDSVVVEQRADTIYKYVYHAQDRWLHDTIFVTRVDSIAVPVIVEEKCTRNHIEWYHWLGISAIALLIVVLKLR